MKEADAYEELIQHADWCEALASTLERDGIAGGQGPLITTDFLNGAVHAYRSCATDARRRADLLRAKE